MLKPAVVVGLITYVYPTAMLLLRRLSAQRSLHSPVPNGSCARFNCLKKVNLPNRCCLSVILWSTRATYSSMFPPVLAAVVKLLVSAVRFVGLGIRPNKNMDVGLMRLNGIMLPANAVRTLLE